MVAVRNPERAVLATLVELFGDALRPGAMDRTNKTALMYACQSGHCDNMRRLVEAFGPAVRPGERDVRGSTALVYAVQSGMLLFLGTFCHSMDLK